jgi:hypothetical protein
MNELMIFSSLKFSNFAILLQFRTKVSNNKFFLPSSGKIIKRQRLLRKVKSQIFIFTASELYRVSARLK